MDTGFRRYGGYDFGKYSDLPSLGVLGNGARRSVARMALRVARGSPPWTTWTRPSQPRH
jgi:hypothetical protein